MAFEAWVGSIQTPTSTGTFTETGIPFQPKIVIFFWNGLGSDISADNLATGFGAAVSSTSRFACWAVDDDNASTTDSGRYVSNNSCYVGTTFTPTLSIEADFDAFTSDGFTLDLTTADGSARTINYLALGGTTLTNVFIKECAAPGSVTNQAYTGLGFQPDCIILASSALLTSPASSVSAPIGIGFASSATARATVAARTDDADAAADTFHGVSNADCLLVHATNGVVAQQADLISFDADGFTLDFTTSAAAHLFYAICLKGGSYKVGEFTQATGTGNQATSGVGFTPAGILLLSANDSSNSTTEAGYSLSIGAAVSAVSQGSIWAGSVDAADPTQSDQNQDRANVIRMMTPTAGAVSTQAVAAFVSKNTDGFTLNWTTADATARTIEYLAFGPGVADGSTVRHLALLGVGT